ncbi:TIGR03086 family metal-binding protein [Amycolatopsis taiwanensis]|uniref:TIGR03086 family protein n=1 Tax=Amycolatopsis taiwanensis TaxID=342230 RepID=A0A9W6RB64_9PSEU|nr:TIGR03086 family metal-binding protein [Amycolatopsis taiwanensis]GLY70750.1 TIGR03086 family protein [Amycolatopsis taiwanensis]
MSNAKLLARAATSLREIIRNIKPEQLGAQTPCTEYDVRKLVNHLLYWVPSLEGAARKETVHPPAQAESELDLTTGDWAAALEAGVERTATAWSEPDAWEGVTHMGGPTELPASLVGGMIVGEWVVHGWDLARATGQHLKVDEDLLEYALEELAKTAEQGREMGMFAPEVAVPPSSPALDRLLALTGRDPAWAPHPA